MKDGTNMTKSGLLELLMRLIVMVLFAAALVCAVHVNGWMGGGLALAGLAVYIWFPRSSVPDGALRYARGPAVIGPDLIGYMLTTIFLALPFLIGIPGTAWMFAPMALVSMLLLVLSAWYASFYLVLGPDEIVLHTLRRSRRVSPGDITGVSAYKRGLPKWMRKLVPFLVMGGAYGAAGSVMLARDETGMELRFADGTRQKIPAQGFEKHFKVLARHLKESGHEVPAKWVK